MEKEDYYVVLRTPVLPGKGDPINTMHWFKNKDQFGKWYSKFKDIHEIVAEGIPLRKAINSSDIGIGSDFAKFMLNQEKVRRTKK